MLKFIFPAYYSSHTNVNHTKKLRQRRETAFRTSKEIALKQFLIKVSTLHNNTGYDKNQLKMPCTAIAL